MLDDIFKKSGIKMSEICIIYFFKVFHDANYKFDMNHYYRKV